MFSKFLGYVEVNGVKVLDGCARCISENGWCEKAAERFNKESVLAEPMSYMDNPLDYPVECLKDWWGNNYRYCSDCKLAFYGEYYEMDCPKCGSSTELSNDNTVDTTDYLFYKDFTDEELYMEGCKECEKRLGKCNCLDSCLDYPLVYTDPFGTLPHGYLLPAYCVLEIDGCQRYCKECRQATTEEIDTCPLCGGEMREFF